MATTTKGGSLPARRAADELVLAAVSRLGAAVRRRGGLVILAVGLGISGQVAYDLARPREFCATAQMWIAGAWVAPAEARYTEPWEDFLATQAFLLQSPRILRDALTLVGERWEAEDVPDYQVERAEDAALLVLTATGTEGPRCERFLRAVVEAYFAYRRGVQSLTRDDAAANLLGELARQEGRIRDAEAVAEALEVDGGLASMKYERAATAVYANRVRMQLGDLRLQEQWLAEAPSEQLFEWSGGMHTAGRLGRLPSLGLVQPMDAAMLAGYRHEREALEALRLQVEEWARLLRPQHPKMQRLEEELARRERLMQAILGRGQAHLAEVLRALRVRIAGLENTLQDAEARLHSLSRAVAQREHAEAEAERQRQLASQLAELLQSVDVSRNLQQESLQLVDEPRVEPCSQGRPLAAGMAGIAAGFLSLIPLGWLEFRRRALDDPGQLSRDLRHRVLGQVPLVSLSEGSRLVSEVDRSEGALVEAFRRLRATLNLTRPPGAPAAVLAGTALGPGDGTTTVLAGLGTVLARAGRRVLLVDANLRNPAVHRCLGLPMPPGLAEVLESGAAWHRLVVSAGPPGLHALCAGQGQTAPGELVVHPGLARLVGEARAAFDCVLVDTPALSLAADAFSLARWSDGVVLVVRCGLPDPRQVDLGVAALERASIPVHWLVLNGGGSSPTRCSATSQGTHAGL